MTDDIVWATSGFSGAGTVTVRAIGKSTLCFASERAALYHLFNRPSAKGGWLLRGVCKKSDRRRSRGSPPAFRPKRPIAVLSCRRVSEEELVFYRTECALEGGPMAWIGVNGWWDPHTGPVKRRFVLGPRIGGTALNGVVSKSIWVDEVAEMTLAGTFANKSAEGYFTALHLGEYQTSWDSWNNVFSVIDPNGNEVEVHSGKSRV